MVAFLGVHPETVAEWVWAHTAGRDTALAAKPHPGRTPFLTPNHERTAEAVTDFLRDVLWHLRGKVVVVWDWA